MIGFLAQQGPMGSRAARINGVHGPPPLFQVYSW
jgi:hypothetical protein